jgi:hypothetical protein
VFHNNENIYLAFFLYMGIVALIAIAVCTGLVLYFRRADQKPTRIAQGEALSRVIQAVGLSTEDCARAIDIPEPLLKAYLKGDKMAPRAVFLAVQYLLLQQQQSVEVDIALQQLWASPADAQPAPARPKLRMIQGGRRTRGAKGSADSVA